MTISDYFNNYSGLIDSHCHLDFKDYNLSIEQIVEKSKEAGLSMLLNVSIDLKSSIESIQTAKKYPEFIKAFIGIDPQVFIPNPEFFIGLDTTDKQIGEFKDQIEELYVNNKDNVIGFGETGMDYFWLKDLSPIDASRSKSLQQKLFEAHIELAEKYSLPLTIHSRAAESECLDVLLGSKAKTKGIFHSFTGNYEQAKAILDSGNGLGVNGIYTFGSAKELREVYKKILGKINGNENPSFFYKKGIFFETDSPFLTPEGKRGDTNYPFNVRQIFNVFTRSLSRL